MFKSKKTFLIFSLVFCLFGCNTTHKMTYFQGQNETSPLQTDYQNKLQLDDKIIINIGGSDMESLLPFQFNSTTSQTQSQPQGNSNNAYIIDIHGNIQMPIIGEVHLAGLTRIEAESLIQEKLKDFVKDVVVKIQCSNSKYTVLGHVNSPGLYHFESDRITIIEGIAQAGDLHLSAKRNNIMLLREEKGQLKKYVVDLSDASVFNSPLYYLKQNDVIYVEPGVGAKIQGSNAMTLTQIIGSSLSLFISVFTLISVTK